MSLQSRELKNSKNGSTTVPSELPREVSTDRTPWQLGLALFCFGAVIALIYTFVIYPRQGAIDSVIDLNGFGKLGRRIASGEGFSLGYGPTLRRAPLYPAFVGTVLAITGNTGTDAQVFRSVLFLQCLLFGATCATVGLTADRLFNRKTGILAGVLCALMPQTLRYVAMTEVETSMGLFIALMGLSGLHLYQKPTVSRAVLFGIITAAASLTKAVALLYAPLFLVLVLWKWHKTGKANKTPLIASGVTLTVFVVCLLPWVVRNHIVSSGKFRSISSNGPGEFLRGYVNAQPKYAFLKQDFGGNEPGAEKWDWEANLMEDALLRSHGMSFFSETRFGPHGEFYPMEARLDLELQKEKIESAEAKRRLLQEPFGFVQKFATQIFTFWYVVETRKKSLIIGGIALVVLTLFGIGWAQARKQKLDVLPVVFPVLYFNLLYAAILAFARYSMPVYPVLLVTASYGVMSLLRQSEPDRAISASV